MPNGTQVWVRPDSSYRPNLLVTIGLLLGLACLWTLLFSISILGSLWRFSEPDAAAPVLSAADQRADLAVLVVQFVVGSIAVASVLLIRKRTLAAALPARRGSAADAAVAFCAAIAASSALVLALDSSGLARFDISVPAVVESPALAALSAVSAGLREEPLMAALPVVLLAGRVPIGAIMVVAGVMRGFLYLYFGGGGFVWAALWGAAVVWVYFKYRRLWVLVVVHGLIMNIQAFDRVIGYDSAAMVLQWANILILFGALTLWIVPRALSSVRLGDRRGDLRTSDLVEPEVSDVPELPHVPPDDASRKPPAVSP